MRWEDTFLNSAFSIDLSAKPENYLSTFFGDRMSESLSRAWKVTPKNEETCEGARVYDGLVSRSWGSEGSVNSN